MQTIKIQTPQNVIIEYEIASMWDRIVANFRDYLIIISYVIVISIFSDSFHIRNEIISYFLLLPVGFYHLLFEIFMNGQSPGMKSRGTKVIRLDGKECTISDYFLRWVLRPLEIVFCTGGIAMLSFIISNKGQRLGDLAAGTTVIKLKNQYSLDNTLFVNQDNNYVPVFPVSDKFNDRDMEIIKEAIKFYENSGNMEPAIQLAKKIKIALDVQTQMAPIMLLKTVLKDYNNSTSSF